MKGNKMNQIMGDISAIEEDKCMEPVELIAFDGLNQIGDITSEDEIKKLNTYPSYLQSLSQF